MYISEDTALVSQQNQKGSFLTLWGNYNNDIQFSRISKWTSHGDHLMSWLVNCSAKWRLGCIIDGWVGIIHSFQKSAMWHNPLTLFSVCSAAQVIQTGNLERHYKNLYLSMVDANPLTFLPFLCILYSLVWAFSCLYFNCIQLSNTWLLINFYCFFLEQSSLKEVL